MVEPASLVVDATGVARWYVNNPPLVQLARRVQADAGMARTSLLAPEKLLHEVAGVIHQAVFAHRLHTQQGHEKLDRSLTVEMILIGTNDLVSPAGATRALRVR